MSQLVYWGERSIVQGERQLSFTLSASVHMDNTAQTHRRVPPQACWASTVLCTSTNHVFGHSTPTTRHWRILVVESASPDSQCYRSNTQQWYWQLPSCQSYKYDVHMKALVLILAFSIFHVCCCCLWCCQKSDFYTETCRPKTQKVQPQVEWKASDREVGRRLLQVGLMRRQTGNPERNDKFLTVLQGQPPWHHNWFLNSNVFKKKKLPISRNGLFSADRLQSSLLWQCPQGESRCPCQQHICIHPQSPPLHWPDNGAALLFLPLHLNQKKRRQEEEEGERRVTFWKPVPTLSKAAKWKDETSLLGVQRRAWTSLISRSSITSLQRTEARPDYSFSKRCLNSVQKREKTFTKLFIKLFVIITLYISAKDTRVWLNLFVLGSVMWLPPPSKRPARLELNRAGPHIVKGTIG